MLPATKHLKTIRYPAAVACTVAVALCQGCAAPQTTVDPQRRQALHTRCEDLLRRAAQSEDPQVVTHAIEALVQTSPQTGLPYFRAAAGSDVPLVRFAGLVALGTVRDRPFFSAIRQRLRDPNALVRLAAAYAAYRCGHRSRAQMLVNALRDHPDENVRAEAAHLIGMLDEPAALGHLDAALRLRANERSQLVEISIYTAQARLGDEEALDRLISYTQYDALSRLLALQSLAELDPPQDARDALLYRLNQPDEYMVHRLLAARALGKLGSDAGYELALEALRFVGDNPDDPEETYRVRFNAALALGEIGNPQAVPALTRMADDADDPRLQVGACFAILRIQAR